MRKLILNFLARIIKMQTSIGKKLVGWFNVRKYRLLLLALAYLVLKGLSLLPYLNLILDEFIIISIAIVLTPIIVDIKPTKLIIITLVLFIPALGLQLLGRFEEAEEVGNFIYVLLFAGVLKGIIDKN